MAFSGGLGAPAGALIGGVSGFLTGMFDDSVSNGTTENSSTISSRADSSSEQNSESNAISTAEGETTTATRGMNKSAQITEKNRHIMSVLKNIDDQIERLENCKNYGMWQWGTYFFADNKLDAKLGADIYSGVLGGENTGVEHNNIGIWVNENSRDNNFKNICMSLAQLQHPIFETWSGELVTHTSLISTPELSFAMCLPHVTWSSSY